MREKIALTVIFFALFTFGFAQEKPSLSEKDLEKNTYYFEISDGKLTGDDAKFLIDELTKHEELKNQLMGGDIIISKDMKEQIVKKFPMLNMIEIDLRMMGLKVRDFDQTEFLYVFRLGDIMTETSEKRAV